MKLKLPRSTQNWITLIGATIALISFSMIAFLFTISVFWRVGHAYLGLVIYILLPSILILGLLLIPIGMWIHIRRERKYGVSDRPPWPRVDLNDRRHRNAFLVFAFGTMLLLFVSAVGSYEAFHFTESVTFCGTVCHDVMAPEFTAYQHSSHARVSCVACHVGSGADWYVRSKLSGAYQVYSTLADKYPRPIPTPIRNLRPARETCETCHWPAKFYARKLRLESHYMFDEDNTQWDIQMLMRIGAEHSAKGLAEGIHWHINPDIKIEYIAADDSRESLPWVRYTNLKTGEITIYNDEDDPIEEADLANHTIRTMDCMDCHNRPSHDYRAPINFINTAITAGEIPQELPEIKQLAIDLCDTEYSSMDSAMLAIKNGIYKFYEEDYPEIMEDDKEMVDLAVLGLQTAFSENIFPDMKVRWDVYPNHIGHLDFDGCFRCHNDTHTSDDGETISMDCNLCHYITAQGTPGEMEHASAGQPLEFEHPDGDDEWKDGLCTDCHTGVEP